MLICRFAPGEDIVKVAQKGYLRVDKRMGRGEGAQGERRRKKAKKNISDKKRRPGQASLSIGEEAIAGSCDGSVFRKIEQFAEKLR